MHKIEKLQYLRWKKKRRTPIIQNEAASGYSLLGFFWSNNCWLQHSHHLLLLLLVFWLILDRRICNSISTVLVCQLVHPSVCILFAILAFCIRFLHHDSCSTSSDCCCRVYGIPPLPSTLLPLPNTRNYESSCIRPCYFTFSFKINVFQGWNNWDSTAIGLLRITPISWVSILNKTLICSIRVPQHHYAALNTTNEASNRNRLSDCCYYQMQHGYLSWWK